MRQDLLDRVHEAITARAPELVALRRHLHQHPELSAQERDTTRALADALSARGLEVRVRPEGTGLIADLWPPGFDPARHRTVALRCDLDALPITEQTGLPFASQRAGVMHACGHDMHTACVIGASLGLEAARDALPGRVRLICQHNEEDTPGGADEMVAFGAMDGVDEVLGLHCDPELPLGRVGLKVGALTAAADLFEIQIHGKGGHSARPHHAVDAIFVAAQVAVALYQGLGRLLDARDPAVLAIGAIHAGQAHNIIPAEATLRGTVRTLSHAQRARVEPTLRALLDGVCATWGARGELTLRRGSPPVINDARAVAALRAAAAATLGPDAIHDLPLPSMGAEDFSQYLTVAPGAMFRLGTARPGQPLHLLHSPRFDPDERALPLGAAILARAALALLADPR
jgi:amidohydrolase